MAASSAQLHASAHLIAKECKGPNYQYLLCKKQSLNPAACLAEGAGVKTCVDDLITRLNSTCEAPFLKFQKCLKDTNNAYEKCVKQKAALHACFEGAKSPGKK
mmetsp:Transcript_15952/g.49990  ORF Transcript_15952/g.49990 Transcript_15952/m.49990 type:complete len:103 (+) Transcript_15952:48-356(+)